jgi:thioredoxin:protein disulfide reductase
MKKIFYPLCLFLYLLLVPPYPSWAETASIEAIQSSDRYHSGKSYPIIFKINVIDGWYIHGVEAGTGEIIPTSLTFDNSAYLKVEDIRFPDTVEKRFQYLTGPIEIFSGEILVSARIAFSSDAPTGGQTVRGRLSYQACSINACKPPADVPVALTFTIVSRGTPTQEINKDRFISINNRKDYIKKGMNALGPDSGILWTLALIFLGGLALNLSPCIYPMIPITVSYFGGKSRRMKGAAMIHGVLYLIGLSVTNSIMGAASALSGNMLGSMLQHPASLITIALIMMILGLSFFEIWELRVPPALNKIASKSFGGYFGTFFMGLTIGIIAAPCIGPFILGLFAYVGQKADPLFGFLCFFVLSMGMGLPICILALFSGAMKRLPLSGDWMLWIRRLMGWVMIGMAIYMISPLIYGRFTKSALYLAVATAAGIHLGWLDHAGQSRSGFVFIKRISGIMIFLLGLGYFYSVSSYEEGIIWRPYDEDLLLKAAQQDKPVILDFYADWCLPCKGLDRTVFRDPEVIALSEKFVLMRLDLTTKQPFQDKILERYHVRGVPVIIFLNRDGVEERNLRVESLVETSEFVSAMRQALIINP